MKLLSHLIAFLTQPVRLFLESSSCFHKFFVVINLCCVLCWLKI